MSTSTGNKSGEKIKDPGLVVEDLGLEEAADQDPEREGQDLVIVTEDQKKKVT